MVKTTENISILGMLQQSIIQPINSSKLFAGLLMIIMNIGSKYVEVKLTKTQEQALRNALCRELIFRGSKLFLLRPSLFNPCVFAKLPVASKYGGKS